MSCLNITFVTLSANLSSELVPSCDAGTQLIEAIRVPNPKRDCHDFQEHGFGLAIFVSIAFGNDDVLLFALFGDRDAGREELRRSACLVAPCWLHSGYVLLQKKFEYQSWKKSVLS